MIIPDAQHRFPAGYHLYEYGDGRGHDQTYGGAGFHNPGHATIAGVLLAFAIPFTGKEDDEESPSHRLEHFLHKPVAFLILPVFALANTAIVVGAGALHGLTAGNSLGIIFGLLLGKPVGITLLSFAAVAAGVCRLPST